MNIDGNYLTIEQLAERWRIPASMLQNWINRKRQHIPFVKVSGLVLYRPEDVLKYEGRENEHSDKLLLTPDELSDRWELAQISLAVWRYKHEKVPFIKIGRYPRYKLEDVLEYEENNGVKFGEGLISTKQLSQRLGIATETLKYWRMFKKGPPFVKMSGSVRYRLEDVQEYEQENAFKFDQDLLTGKQLAKRWGVTVESLQNWRTRKKGPPFVKISGLVRYRLDDIREYEENNGLKLGEQLLSTKQLSERLGVTIPTLNNWRMYKKGPTFVKILGSVRYRLEDVQEYEKTNQASKSDIAVDKNCATQ